MRNQEVSAMRRRQVVTLAPHDVGKVTGKATQRCSGSIIGMPLGDRHSRFGAARKNRSFSLSKVCGSEAERHLIDKVGKAGCRRRRQSKSEVCLGHRGGYDPIVRPGYLSAFGGCWSCGHCSTCRPLLARSRGRLNSCTAWLRPSVPTLFSKAGRRHATSVSRIASCLTLLPSRPGLRNLNRRSARIDPEL